MDMALLHCESGTRLRRVLRPPLKYCPDDKPRAMNRIVSKGRLAAVEMASSTNPDRMSEPPTITLGRILLET